MAKYRKIDTRMWRDEKFLALDEGTQWLFMHLLTSPYTSMMGTVSMTTGMLAEFLHKSSETVAKRLRNLSESQMIMVDERGLIWICNFLKYNAPSNPNMAKGFMDVLDDLPECNVQIIVIKQAIESCNENGFTTIAETIAKRFKNRLESNFKPFRNQEQEQEQDISSLSPQQAVGTTGNETVVLPKQDKTPTKRIVDLYNERFNGKLPLVREITSKRRTLVRNLYEKIFKRCECENEDEGLLAVGEYFGAIERSNWLMGRDPKSNGWRADFDFVFAERCYVGMLEGKYANR